MLAILGDLLPYAVPVALSPLPIIAVVMLLLAPGGTRGGAAFLTGRLAALATLTLGVAALAGRLPEARGSGEAAPWLRVALGGALMLGAVVLWRRAARDGDSGKPPAWLRSIDGAGPGRALRLGLLLTAVNVKELAFAAGAGMIVGMAPLAFGRTLALSVLFAVLAGLGVAVPVVWMAVAPERARSRLGTVRDWLVRYNGPVMAAVLLVVGAMLVGSGIEAL